MWHSVRAAALRVTSVTTRLDSDTLKKPPD